jgi:hypothetical protein
MNEFVFGQNDRDNIQNCTDEDKPTDEFGNLTSSIVGHTVLIGGKEDDT